MNSVDCLAFNTMDVVNAEWPGRELTFDLCQKFVNFCVSEAKQYDSI